MNLNLEIIGFGVSIISGLIAALVKLNKIENQYLAEKSRIAALEHQVAHCAKQIELLSLHRAKLKAQLDRDFNNLSWQLRIIIGSLEDIEKFLEKSGNYHRRKSCELAGDEDTRGFMRKKIDEFGGYDSPSE